MKNLKFTDDKLWFRHYNKIIFLLKGVNSIPYHEIENLSVYKNKNKYFIIFLSSLILMIGYYYRSYAGLYLMYLGLLLLIYGLIFPAAYLCIESNSKNKFYVYISGCSIQDLINLIYDLRNNLD